MCQYMYLCNNVCSMGNARQEELEIYVQSQGFDVIAVTDTWCDSSHDTNLIVIGYMLFRKDRTDGQYLCNGTAQPGGHL